MFRKYFTIIQPEYIMYYVDNKKTFKNFKNFGGINYGNVNQCSIK